MKKIILGSAITLACISSVYAAPEKTLGGIKQNIQVCLTVEGSTAADGFQAGFVSHDFFDHKRFTQTIRNGQQCVNHIYKHGPKNIKLVVKNPYSNSTNPRFIKIIPDATCSFMKNAGRSGEFESNYIRLSGSAETLGVKLVQMAPQDDFRYVYGMSCSHATA